MMEVLTRRLLFCSDNVNSTPQNENGHLKICSTVALSLETTRAARAKYQVRDMGLLSSQKQLLSSST